MNKVLISLLTLMIVLFPSIPTTTLAHTSLTDSSPEDGETVQEALEQIELSFNTPIENLSTFDTIDEEGEAIFADITIEEDTMIGQLADPLPNGSYTLKWSIIGADGHPIEGEFSFNVDVPEEGIGEGHADEQTQEKKETNETNEKSETNESDEENKAEDRENEQVEQETVSSAEEGQEIQETQEEQETQEASPLLIILGLVLFLLIIFSIWWLIRRT